MEHQPPPLFARGPAPLVRLMFFAGLSVLLMVLDARFRYAETLRQVLALIGYPLQLVALAPSQIASGTADYFSSLSRLERENEALRGRQLEVSKDLLTLEALHSENQQLRRLLEARERLPRKSAFADILYAGRDAFSRRVVIDKGAGAGIVAGMAVADDRGIIGQVTRVYPLLAEVTLITDKDHAIPVQVVRNGLRAVLYGAGDGTTLDLRFMASNADIRQGDTLVTSGIDGIYPAGLPVATVARIERDAAYVFARISCLPAAGTGHYGQVLVLSHEARMPPRPESEPEPARATKAKRSRKRE